MIAHVEIKVGFYMKTIKNITVKVTYWVGLIDVEVPDDVYQSLMDCEGMNLSGDNMSIDCADAKAIEWLSYNLHEDDAYDFEFEIEDIE